MLAQVVPKASSRFWRSTAKSVIARTLVASDNSSGSDLDCTVSTTRDTVEALPSTDPSGRCPRSFEPPQSAERPTAKMTMNLCKGVRLKNHFSSFANGPALRQSMTSHRTRKPMAAPTSHGVVASMALCTYWVIMSITTQHPCLFYGLVVLARNP